MEHRMLSVCLGKDARRTVDISPCLDPGCSIRSPFNMNDERELPLSRKALTFHRVRAGRTEASAPPGGAVVMETAPGAKKDLKPQSRQTSNFQTATGVLALHLRSDLTETETRV
ncbi:putative phosphoinositide 3-kinase regulatory subunit 6-like [Scophthalmus maximus]|uniref:Putative phosphoinositide 3-kinase regulatory subunit 6-like n=1 Tax=Scophthalmus maximus TaxID=52904 RepID=A0A2U9CPJ3_SCOMX|nr:putative phosphoinositide 3-kinase regulatory subunit 6-like [Scophthalmus maximus]